MISKKNLLVLSFLTSVFCDVNTERGFSTFRQKHGINYLQYIGLIPGNIQCLKWGYKTTNFNFFKLEIVCLLELKVHDGTCPIWQQCHWYRYFNYFPLSCQSDNDCDSTCKCCFSPCFGTLTCRPAIKRLKTSSTTREIISTTQAIKETDTTTTTTTDAQVTANEEEVRNEVDYNAESTEANNVGPSVLQESEYEDSSQQVGGNNAEDDARAQDGRDEAKVRDAVLMGDKERELISLGVEKIDDGGGEEEEVDGSGSGDGRFQFGGKDGNVFITDDEDLMEEGSG